MSDSSAIKPIVIDRREVVTRLLILLALLVLLSPSRLRAQEEGKEEGKSNGQEHIGLPTDWSHRHMVFSAPGSPMEAFNLSQNPRYIEQWFRRHVERRLRKLKSHGDLNADWSQSMGTGATVGAGQYPAKYAFSIATDSCANDFVVFNTSLAGTAGQASIIAYNNLYSGCGGTVPSVYWAYDTGGTVSTSVGFSLDGSQLVFVQAQAGVATLVLLKWKASTTESATAPGVLSNTAVGSYRGCTAPCMTTIAFHATNSTDPTPTDTYSAPFYDFTPGSDTLYVGDDSGYLHQFTGVFNGTPGESTTAPWPVQTATAKLSSPIYDPVSGNVFVTTSFQTSNNSGGRLQTVCAISKCAGVNNGNGTTAIGTATPSGILGPDTAGNVNCRGTGTSGNGSNLRLDAPIVDSTAGKVYVFLGNDGGGNSVVIQFPTAVSSTSYHSCPAETTVGTGSTTGITLFAGNFDNAYFTSATGSSPNGNLYVCGNTSGNATLYQVPITSNAMATSGTSLVAVSSANTTCAPVTEVFSANTDLIFVSAVASGVSAPCAAAGCIYNVKVTPWQASTAYAVGQEILDTHLQVQVVETAGTSNTTVPTWSTTTGGATADKTVTWLNQGPLPATIATVGWQAHFAYTVGTLIFDSNNNIELCITATGKSGGAPPTVWSTTPGTDTADGTNITWENLGANGSAALSTAGGTSGIILDNTVAPGTLHTSQVYFSTLTGGTAVQASQAALQ
jgi:hypothetical protein